MSEQTQPPIDQPLAIIILAAGKGSRMKSPLPKVLHPLAGLPMLLWLVQSCESLGPQKIVVVRNNETPEIDDLVAPHETAIQHEQNGTGDAVRAAMPALAGFDGRILIVMGDEPFVPLGALADMAARTELCVMGFETSDPHGLGRMVTDANGYLESIIEEKDCNDDQRAITLCNAGNYGINADDLRQWIDALDNNNAQGEFYITDLPEIARKQGHKTSIAAIEWEGPWGINTQNQLAAHEKLLQNALRADHLNAGVHMLDPESVYFNYDTRIEAGVTIEPHVFFGAGVHIESGVRIKAFSHIEGATLKSGSSAGPYARIRPGSQIGEGAKIGNFVEINRSDIGEGAKIGHHCYVGDTQMGRGVNYSAGAITANYDGINKHKTIIGDHVMIGTNVNLVAPLIIEQNAFIAAGSTITENVPANALAISREKKTKIIPEKGTKTS